MLQWMAAPQIIKTVNRESLSSQADGQTACFEMDVFATGSGHLAPEGQEIRYSSNPLAPAL